MSAASPKRKRGHTLPLDTVRPTPRLLNEGDLEDHIESPRTKFARQFDDLDIHGTLEKLEGDEMPKSVESTHLATLNQPDTPVSLRNLALPKSKRQLPDFSTVPVGPQGTLMSSSEAPSRSKSPPLAGEISDDFWHDSEITGHNPDDPEDDGYGINGIGFKPTAAMAWTRSQQRKQQLAEYKNREAREARRQRSERRKRLFEGGADEEDSTMESSPRKAARVHFEDG